MASAIIMAGHNEHESIQHRSDLWYYGMSAGYISTYKPLYDIVTSRAAKSSKPLIMFAVEALEAVSTIEDIVIVGLKDRLLERIGERISSSPKKITVVDQSCLMSQEFREEIGLDAIISPGTVCYNGLLAYSATAACREKAHALYVACDSPMISADGISEFLSNTARHKDACIAYPITLMDKERNIVKRIFNRRNFYLINDTPYLQDDVGMQREKPQPFRVSAYMTMNPHLTQLNKINIAYNLRKFLSWRVQCELAGVLYHAGFLSLLWKYATRRLRISEVADAASGLLGKDGSKVAIIPDRCIESTYDFDCTRQDAVGIRRLLGRRMSYKGSLR